MGHVPIRPGTPVVRKRNSPSTPDLYPTSDPAPFVRGPEAEPLAPPPSLRYPYVGPACADRGEGRGGEAGSWVSALSAAATQTDDGWVSRIPPDHLRLFFNRDTWPAVKGRALGPAICEPWR